MGIREKEDQLFNDWMKNYTEGTFVKDGIPFPDLYQKSDVKILFMLKDANLGNSSSNQGVFDLRGQLSTDPHAWWSKVSEWCYVLENGGSDKSWSEIRSHVRKSDSNTNLRDALSSYGFVQTKKIGGLGSISRDELKKYVENDEEFLRKQIEIYEPDIMVCCGTADFLSKILSSDSRRETANGVGYYSARVGHKTTFLVDYCHPSARMGSKVAGVVAYGLNDAVCELAKQYPLRQQLGDFINLE